MKNTLLTSLLIAGAVTLHAAPDQPAPKPNILILIADDLGWADVGFNGSKEILTPNIDSLATHGIRCTNGYVTAPQCSPSRAGLLTGRNQKRFGHENNNYLTACFATGQRVFPEHFKPAGYATGIVGKWHIGDGPDGHPQQHGFDEFYGFQGGGQNYLAPRPQDLQNPVVRGTTPVPWDGRSYLTDTLGRESADFIRRHTDRPWFLYTAFNAPHMPMVMPPGYEEKVKHIKDPKRAVLAAMVMSMDDAVGEILGALRATGQEGRTLIVFLSDNGGTATPGKIVKNYSFNVPYRGVKGDVYEGGIRVPFVIQWKDRLPEGKAYNAPVSSLDLLPTALAAAGVKPLPDVPLEGVNLLPYLTGEMKDPPHDHLCWSWQSAKAVRQGDWKWMVNNGSSPVELFNLAEDPYETNNLAAAHPKRVKSLQALFEAWNAKNPPLNPAHLVRETEKADGEPGDGEKSRPEAKAKITPLKQPGRPAP